MDKKNSVYHILATPESSEPIHFGFRYKNADEMG